MPQKKAPAPEPVVRTRKPTFTLLESWVPETKRSDTARANFPNEHACGYCGAVGYRHKTMRPQATLFCDAGCRAAYKALRHRPRLVSKRLIPTPKPPRNQRPTTLIRADLRALIAAPVLWANRPYR